MRVIAVDFDGCLCENAWPNIGAPNHRVLRRLRWLRATKQAKVILWTCRVGTALEEAVCWCHRHGLDFDAVNDNLPERKLLYGNNSRKVGADEYWDDRAVAVRYE